MSDRIEFLPFHYPRDPSIEAQKFILPGADVDYVLSATRIAYRRSVGGPWLWWGPAICFKPLEDNLERWSQQMALEAMCKDCRATYPSLDAYVRNVQLVVAPSLEALSSVDLSTLPEPLVSESPGYL